MNVVAEGTNLEEITRRKGELRVYLDRNLTSGEISKFTEGRQEARILIVDASDVDKIKELGVGVKGWQLMGESSLWPWFVGGGLAYLALRKK